jgi:tRNA uridine 5-carbamoylmethylation protein Kti12
MFKEFLELGCDIVVDEVNVSKQYRQKYISEAKAKGYTVTAIVLPRLPKEEAVNRRMSNPHDSNTREHWEDVWDKFEAKYEMPTEEEGFDKVIDFSVK